MLRSGGRASSAGIGNASATPGHDCPAQVPRAEPELRPLLSFSSASHADLVATLPGRAVYWLPKDTQARRHSR